MKPARTWILIADAARARIVENCGLGKGLHQIERGAFAAEPAKGFSDQEGRTFTSFSPARHKMENQNTQDPAIVNHVDDVFTSLSRAIDAKKFDRLIICAEPQTLGVMRNRIPDVLKGRLTAEIDKDLTHVPTDELPQYFADVLAV